MSSSRLGLTIYEPNSTTGSDISRIVSQLKLTGRKGSSARSLEITLADDDNRGNSRINLRLLKGYRCIFTWDGKELFRGVIFRKNPNSEKKTVYKAYDFGIYLAKNKESFCYENYTLTEVFRDICGRFGIRYSYAYETAYILPTIAKSKKTAWDVLCDAMSKQYEATGNRYYIDSEKDYLRLMRRADNIKQWVLEPGKNLRKFSQDVSIENTRTRYKLYSTEDTVSAWTWYPDMEAALGIMQEVETTRDTLTKAQAIERTQEKIKKYINEEETLKIEALGVPDIISGVAVYVIIPALGLNQTYYVDADTHTFKDNEHMLSVTLNRFNDSEY